MNNNIHAECSSRQYGFSYVHISGAEARSTAHLDKNLFSVLMLIDGEIDYDVEGKLIHITPNDILIVGSNELHRSIIGKNIECEYLLLMVNLDYFIKNNCTSFSEMVFSRSLGDNNVIPAKTVLSKKISDIFLRLDYYCSESNVELAVVNAVIIELLYNLNKHAVKSGKTNYNHAKINDIIAYINDNITEHLSLEDIANKFFLTKQYLCKLFKNNTGYTINNYIAYKRIVLVREAYSYGLNLSESCYKAGFSDYSSFYRAYSKIMQESPKKSLSGK